MVIVRVLVLGLSLAVIAACENTPHRQVVPANTGSYESEIEPVETDYGKPSRSTTPAIVFTLTERATKAMHAENWATAQRSLEQALRIAPNEARIYLVYGDLHQRQYQYEQARQMYYRAISLAGESSETGKQAQTQLEQLAE